MPLWLESIIERFGLPRFLALVGTSLVTLGFMGYLLLRSSTPEMSLLFSQLDAADGAKILERLKTLNIPVEVKGDQIYAPTSHIFKLRMELAGDGLPAGGTVGYEIFDKTDVLGTTSGLMDINLLRAVEGEISKSIKTIQGVELARVHLVIPKKELFSNDKVSPSASILIKMKGNSRLSVNQVLSIQHLVASAVPHLSFDRISIVDDKGTLLAKGQDTSNTLEASGSTQQEVKLTLESKLSRSIESLLERTVGIGKIRAEVTADMDFDKITSTSVEYNPDGQVARTHQTTNEGSNSNEASALEGVAVQTEPGTQNKNQDNRSEENIAFEISNTTKNYMREVGAVKRLSIAVLVDGMYEKDTHGNNVFKERSEKEMNQLTDLIKTAVGFDEKRGDKVTVLNMPFQDIPELTESPFQFTAWLMSSNMLENMVLWGVVFALLFWFVRPFLQQVFEKPVPPPVVEPDEWGLQSVEDHLNHSSVKKIGEMAQKHPDEAVKIIRSWIYG